jgi:hypothetical protein
MKKAQQLLLSLSPQYFWDVDISKLDDSKSKRLIVERVFTMGTSKEITLTISYYGRQEVLDILLELNYIDPKTLNFISVFFKTPTTRFKCYARKQSIPQHWNS